MQGGRAHGQAFSALLVGLGIGTVGGAYLGAAATWTGVVVALVGVVSFVAARRSNVGGEAKDQPASQRPTLSGLGSRVEQILSLAKQQAEEHRNSAKRQAERTLLEARAEARAIVDKARAEAAGLTGVPTPEVDGGSHEN